MGYKTGIDRKQMTLLPVCLDDYIPEDHICRVISAFTGRLDMASLGYKYGECKDTGNRPYDPRTMLNLYLYGYLHRIRSSRRLRDECRRNVEVMWLMEGLQPEDRAICSFRKDNAAALKGAFLKFVTMSRELGLYGEEVVVQDGTKMWANNALRNTHNQIVVENELGRIEERINKYLDALSKMDQEGEEEEEPSRERIRAALEALQGQQEKYRELRDRVVAEGEVSTVDADARLMHYRGDGRELDAGYNVQTVVDSKYHMVAEFEVTNKANDYGTLQRMSEKTKEILEVDEITVLADTGYYSGKDIAACEENGVTCLVAKPGRTGPKKAEGFDKKDFIYDKEQDVYVCPCQNILRHWRDKTTVKGKEYRGYSNHKACGACPQRSKCTKSAYREVLRQSDQDTLDRVDERTRNNRGLYRKRQEIVEHVFGTIKSVWGYRQYLCRGKAAVGAETALAYLAYNMRRAVNIFAGSRINLAAALG